MEVEVVVSLVVDRLSMKQNKKKGNTHEMSVSAGQMKRKMMLLGLLCLHMCVINFPSLFVVKRMKGTLGFGLGYLSYFKLATFAWLKAFSLIWALI